MESTSNDESTGNDEPTSNDFTFEGGDVRIKVRGPNGILDGLVCSQVLCHSSEVWKKFIYPPFPQIKSPSSAETSTESSSAQSTMNTGPLDFTDDNYEALQILFYLAHHCYKDIPSTPLPHDLLLALAKACRKYACAELISPFAQKWIDSTMEDWDDPEHQEGYLFISWVFGNLETFMEQAIYLSTSLYVFDDTFKRWSELGFIELDPELIPPSLQNAMMTARAKSITTIISSLDFHLNYLQVSDIQCTKDDEDCDHLVFSALVRGLSNQSFWPPSHIADFPGPIEMIIEKLELVEEELEPWDLYEEFHEECRTLDLETLFEEAQKVIGREVVGGLPKNEGRGFEVEMSQEGLEDILDGIVEDS